MREPTKREPDSPREHLLEGLAGDNPLAFLAAMGTLRVLSQRWHDRRIRMSWRCAGPWRPVLHIEGGCERTEVVAELHAALTGRDCAPEFTLVPEGVADAPREITLSPDEFRRIACVAASLADRTLADFCTASTAPTHSGGFHP